MNKIRLGCFSLSLCLILLSQPAWAKFPVKTTDGIIQETQPDAQTKVVKEKKVSQDVLKPGQRVIARLGPIDSPAIKVIIQASATEAPLPKPSPKEQEFMINELDINPFGVNIRFGKQSIKKIDPQMLKRLYTELGVQLRTIGVYYQSSVPIMQLVNNPGPNQTYNWSKRLDRIIAQSASAGIQSLLTLSPHTGHAKMPKELKHWKSFVRQIVERYSDKKHGGIRYFALVNEPAVPVFWNDSPENYAHLLRATYFALKDANPQALLVLGSIPIEVVVNQPSRQDFFPKVLRYRFEDGSRAEDYFDVVDIHVYSEPASFKKYIKQVKGWLSRPKPMIMTETGSSSDPKYGSLKKQAQDVIKRFVTALGLGIEAITWQPLFDHKPVGLSHMDRFDKVGLLDDGLNPKPAYYTFQLMVKKLKGFKTVRTLAPGQYEFSFTNKESVYVLWNDNGAKKVDIKAEIGSPQALVTHIVEAEGITGPRAETISTEVIPLTTSPIFVEAIAQTRHSLD